MNERWTTIRDRLRHFPPVNLAVIVAFSGIIVLAFVCFVLLVVGAHASGASRATWIATGILSLIPALSIAGLFIVAAAFYRMMIGLRNALRDVEQQQQEVGRALEDLRAQVKSDPDPSPVAAGATNTPNDERPWEDIVRMLGEIRELALLPEDKRKQRMAQYADEEISRVESQIETLMHKGHFVRARESAVQVAARYPEDIRAAALPGQVDAARDQRKDYDIAAISVEVSDLISMSAWEQARAKAQQLQEQHPDCAEAHQLMVRIERDFRMAQDEQQRRMYAEVQRFVTRRRWGEALAATRTFIDRFAGSDDAEAMRLQLPTLETNAEIEHRQQLEAQIMDLARHCRYIEALTLARRVIEQFPDSPQADALRGRIGRLEQLANNPQAPPARVRLDQ